MALPARSASRARVLVGLAAERDLVDLFAVLLDPENADVADVMVAAGIDAAGNIDVQPAEIRAADRDCLKRRVISWAIGIERVLARLQ